MKDDKDKKDVREDKYEYKGLKIEDIFADEEMLFVLLHSLSVKEMIENLLKGHGCFTYPDVNGEGCY